MLKLQNELIYRLVWISSAASVSGCLALQSERIQANAQHVKRVCGSSLYIQYSVYIIYTPYIQIQLGYTLHLQQQEEE